MDRQQGVLVMKWTEVVSLLIISLCSQGCGFLFFQPDRYTYQTPKAVGLASDDIFFTSKATGERLHVLRLKPEIPLGNPNILYFHGNAQNISAHFLFAAWLTDFGYQIDGLDYQGYGKSGGVVGREHTIQDIRQFISMVCQASPKGLVLYGQSLGGALLVGALGSMKKNTCIKGVVLEAAFHSYRFMAQDVLSRFFLTYPLQYPLSFLVNDEYQPLKAASNIRYPVLQMHGSDDPIVPIESGKELSVGFSNLIDFWEFSTAQHIGLLSLKEKTKRLKFLKLLCDWGGAKNRCLARVEQYDQIYDYEIE